MSSLYLECFCLGFQSFDEGRLQSKSNENQEGSSDCKAGKRNAGKELLATSSESHGLLHSVKYSKMLQTVAKVESGGNVTVSEFTDRRTGIKRPASSSPLAVDLLCKRQKISDKTNAVKNENVLRLRSLVCDKKQRKLFQLRKRHREHSIEMFFLQHGGNLMNYYEWRKRPNPQLDNFLKSSRLDSDEEFETTSSASAHVNLCYCIIIILLS